jgi:hypothetical protein
MVVALGAVGAWMHVRTPTGAKSDGTAAAIQVKTNLSDEAPSLDRLHGEHALEETPEELMVETLELDPPSPEQANAYAVEQLQKSLRMYEEFTVYPPWSRPYADNMRHYVEWNKLRPEGQPFAVDEEKRELSIEVSLDRMYAAPGEAIDALVKVGRLEDGVLLPAAFDRVTARIEWNDPENGYSLAQPLTLEQQGTNFTVSFVPAQIEALAARPREAMFTAEVKKGVFFKVIRIPFQYAVEPVFQVLGIAGDRVENGSLVVDLEVAVAHATPTLIQAVLYDESGQTPIAVYDDYFRPTEPGQQIATITFFGKVLREKNVTGPYSIRALHGVGKNPDAEPQESYWKRDDTPRLLTKLYFPTQFSDADWSSPEKDEKIRQYTALIEAGGL